VHPVLNNEELTMNYHWAAGQEDEESFGLAPSRSSHTTARLLGSFLGLGLLVVYLLWLAVAGVLGRGSRLS
jgi:hypothetical protein